MIPPEVERRARWVLDTIGAHELGLGDDVPYREEAWEQVARGGRPAGDDLAEAFFHLARLEERAAQRDRHGRVRASSSCLDPLDPPVDRLRARLGIEPPRWGGARFAVALTHDVDVVWRWTRRGIRAGGARVRDHARARRYGDAAAGVRALAAIPVHRLRGTDPYWRFEQICALEARLGARSTFFVMTGHRHVADGPSPEAYASRRARLVEALAAGGAEVGLHASYTAAEDAAVLAQERDTLAALTGSPVAGQRFHYLRVDPHANLRELDRLGFRYDSSLGFPDALGFRAGSAHPFRPWDLDRDRPLDLVEIPLAAMDATLAEERYLGLSAAAAEPRLLELVAWAAEHGGGFSILWHTERFDRGTARGWDRVYARVVAAIQAAGGVCVTAEELAEEAAGRLGGRGAEAPAGGGAR